jgi:hypothetical protein
MKIEIEASGAVDGAARAAMKADEFESQRML